MKRLLAFSPAQRQQLLALARQGIEHHLLTGEFLATDDADTPSGGPPGGLFVTLKAGGQLRGCIGRLGLDPAPLAQQVVRCAIAAATQDPRFSPVQPQELSGLHLEISVLSELFRVTAPEEIVVGRDGLQIEAQGRRGLLLPQVAVEQGWDRDTFLKEVCRKAGLQPDAWRTGRLHRFTAEIFQEGK